MTATAILVMKIMPESPEAPIEKIKEEVKSRLEQHGAKGVAIEEQNVAFGLKAIIVKAAVPEEKGSEFFENQMFDIAHVSSVTIEDYRRAFG